MNCELYLRVWVVDTGGGGEWGAGPRSRAASRSRSTASRSSRARRSSSILAFPPLSSPELVDNRRDRFFFFERFLNLPLSLFVVFLMMSVMTEGFNTGRLTVLFVLCCEGNASLRFIPVRGSCVGLSFVISSGSSGHGLSGARSYQFFFPSASLVSWPR